MVVKISNLGRKYSLVKHYNRSVNTDDLSTKTVYI